MPAMKFCGVIVRFNSFADWLHDFIENGCQMKPWYAKRANVYGKFNVLKPLIIFRGPSGVSTPTSILTLLARAAHTQFRGGSFWPKCKFYEACLEPELFFYVSFENWMFRSIHRKSMISGPSFIFDTNNLTVASRHVRILIKIGQVFDTILQFLSWNSKLEHET